jgi:hypothetical protein
VLCGWNVYVMRRGYHARQSVVDLVGMNHLLHITTASTTPKHLQFKEVEAATSQ